MRPAATNPDVRTDPEVVLKAGGLVWRRNRRGRRLAVIRRERHRDWTLPKGHRQPDEPESETAVREVWEETRCRARVTEFAGTACYETGGRPVVVLYWHMEPVSVEAFVPNEEVAEVVWLTPRQALRRLDHASERALVARVSGRRDPGSERAPWRALSKPFQRWPALIRSRAYRRLDAALRTYGPELTWRLEADDQASPAWSTAATALLAQARRCLRRGLIDEGWQALAAAHRLEVFALGQEERAARGAALRAEAERKLSEWRRDAVLEALGADGAPTPGALWYATLMRDENAQNEYRKLAVLSDQLTAMGVFVGLTLLLIVLLASWHPIPFDDYGSYAGSFELLVYVILFGVLGGAVSTMIPRDARGLHRRIPERLSDAAFSRLRPLIGAASALVVYIAVVADLLPVALDADFGAAILLLAFVAGFSERLVVRAIESVAGRDERPAEPAGAPMNAQALATFFGSQEGRDLIEKVRAGGSSAARMETAMAPSGETSAGTPSATPEVDAPETASGVAAEVGDRS
jgi:8-oxo-(d)GTP phosphatase